MSVSHGTTIHRSEPQANLLVEQEEKSGNQEHSYQILWQSIHEQLRYFSFCGKPVSRIQPLGTMNVSSNFMVMHLIAVEIPVWTKVVN